MQSGFVKTIPSFHTPSGAIARNRDRRRRLGCRCSGTCGRFADGDHARFRTLHPTRLPPATWFLPTRGRHGCMP